MRSLLVIACCIAIASCGAARKSSAPAPAAAPTSAAPDGGYGGEGLPPDPRDAIKRLDAEITAARTQLQLDAPSEAMLQGAPVAPMAVAPSSEDPTCRPAPTDTCKTSCTLSDSICSNAEKICKLAQDMGQDNWSQNMCAKANKTCEASRAKCCGCQ